MIAVILIVPGNTTDPLSHIYREDRAGLEYGNQLMKGEHVFGLGVTIQF